MLKPCTQHSFLGPVSIVLRDCHSVMNRQGYDALLYALYHHLLQYLPF